MTGSILSRSADKHLLRVELGRDAITGRRRQKTRTFTGPKRAAEKALRQWLREFEETGVASPDKVTLNELFAKWLKAKAPDVSENTITLYRIHHRLYFRDDIGKLPISKVTTDVIKDFYSRKGESGLSQSVLDHIHSVLHQALDLAVEDRQLAQNPASKAKKKGKKRKKKREEVQALTSTQARLFLDIEDEFDRILFSTALVSGCRPGEVLGLRWPRVRFARNEIAITEAMVQVRDNVPYLGPTKTEESRRTIAMPEEAMADLKALRAVLEARRTFAGEEWEENDLVFPDRNGKLQRLGNVRRRFKRQLRRAQLPTHFKLYCLRHTCATLLMMEAGVNIKVVSERLGHATVQQTLETYVHCLPSMQKQAADKLGEMFYPSRKVEE